MLEFSLSVVLNPMSERIRIAAFSRSILQNVHAFAPLPTQVLLLPLLLMCYVFFLSRVFCFHDKPDRTCYAAGESQPWSILLRLQPLIQFLWNRNIVSLEMFPKSVRIHVSRFESAFFASMVRYASLCVQRTRAPVAAEATGGPHGSLTVYFAKWLRSSYKSSSRQRNR